MGSVGYSIGCPHAGKGGSERDWDVLKMKIPEPTPTVMARSGDTRREFIVWSERVDEDWVIGESACWG